MTRASRTIRRDERGATIVEFAFVAPVMAIMICGAFDVTHQAYARAVLEGTVEKAGRDATLQTGAAAVSEPAFDQAIATKVSRVTGAGACYTGARDLRQ